MDSSKPAILIISGGMHVPENYTKLKESLQGAGYEVHVPRLPSMNEARPPTADLYSDSELIRKHAMQLIDQGKRLVTIMHSYGGQVGTNALHGLGLSTREAASEPGGVTDLIYMTGAACEQGKTMFDKMEEMGSGHLLPIAFNFDEDKSVVCADPRTMMFGPDVQGPEIDAYLSTMVRWNGNCLYQTIKNPCAWKEIPVTFIYTTQDHTLPFEFQKSIVEYMEQQGVKVKTHQIISGHCPNLHHSDEIVEIVNGLSS